MVKPPGSTKTSVGYSRIEIREYSNKEYWRHFRNRNNHLKYNNHDIAIIESSLDQIYLIV